MTVKILLVVLAALTALLGLHMVFGLALLAALAAGFVVVRAGSAYGWGCVPRGVRS